MRLGEFSQFLHSDPNRVSEGVFALRLSLKIDAPEEENGQLA